MGFSMQIWLWIKTSPFQFGDMMGDSTRIVIGMGTTFEYDVYIIYSNWEGCAWDTVGISFGYRREDNRI